MGSYVPTTAAEREEMLAAIGVKSLEDLYQAVPQEMLLNGTLNIPEGMSELEVREAVTAMAEKNKVYKTVLRGAGAYRHFIPAVVKSITSREELVTCYTPYQAEISQLNSDPYGAWIIKVEGIGGTEELLDAAAYEAHCAEEG